MSGVGARAPEIPLNHGFELLESAGLNVELPFQIGTHLVLQIGTHLALQIGTHLALHMVDLSKGERALSDDTPGFVGICVIADDPGRDHKRGDEEAVRGGTACGDEPGLQSLQ